MASMTVTILNLHIITLFISNSCFFCCFCKNQIENQLKLLPQIAVGILKLPESADLGDIVIAEFKGLASLIEDLSAHERIDKPPLYEAVHLRAEPTFESHVPEFRGTHGILYGIG